MDGDVDSEQGRGEKCGESQPMDSMDAGEDKRQRVARINDDNRQRANRTRSRAAGWELSITVLTDNN